jgi:cbb3-type cytochrome oxidase cytochrome c subunit
MNKYKPTQRSTVVTEAIMSAYEHLDEKDKKNISYEAEAIKLRMGNSKVSEQSLIELFGKLGIFLVMKGK